jgi:AAA family ATP:ADP antiporter
MLQLKNLPQEERRAALGAFVTLLGIMAGHALAETARDTLFLQSLPASQLAWVYLGIAALAVILGQAEQRVLDRFGGPRGLSMVLVVGAGALFAFWSLTQTGAQWVFYALYIWSGVFATLVTIQFWTVLGNTYTVSQAKLVFGFVGAGSVTGALLGATVARILLHRRHDPKLVLLAAAVALLVSALGPLVAMKGPPAETARQRARRPRFTLRDNLPLLRSDPYMRRVATLVLISSIAFTLVDYVFKSVLSRHVRPDLLGSWFASIYVLLNLVALVAQLGAVTWLIRKLGVTRAIAVLPLLLLLGGAGLAAGGGLAAVLLLKGSDGGLRHSLHRTSIELLYVPISDSVRRRMKALLDGVGQRGGQAIGSILILAVGAFASAEQLIPIAIVVVTGIWIFTAAGIRTHYLDLFRTVLREDGVERPDDAAALDGRSLETLIEALNSPEDSEVLAAVELLALQKRPRLIPALILYHPSLAVVVRSLEVFAAAGRKDIAPHARRLLSHADSDIRVAALTALTAVDLDEALLRKALLDPSAAVHTAALVQLVTRGWLRGDDAERELTTIARQGSPEARLALVRGIRLHPTEGFERVLLQLAESDDPVMLAEVAQAMGEVHSPQFVPVLVRMLGDRDRAVAARAALVAIGEPALTLLDAALGDATLPHAIRRHLPRTISRFPARAAAPVLLGHLAREQDGMIAYKILRGLGGVQASDPAVLLDAVVLGEVTHRTLAEIFQMIDWRLLLERAIEEVPSRDVPSHELLLSLLRGKEAQAKERLFRLLGLSHPTEDFERIYAGIRNGSAEAHAGSQELLDHLLAPPLHDAVLGVVSGAPDADRLLTAGALYASEPMTYEELLTRMLASDSESLRCITAYHVGEIGLEVLRPVLQAAPTEPTSPFAAVLERAIAMLDGRAIQVAVAG